jgi:predicted dinucleotide-utilizing enzyme
MADITQSPAVPDAAGAAFYSYPMTDGAAFAQTLPDDAGVVALTQAAGPRFQNTTITLPANPKDGQVIVIITAPSNFGTYTIVPNTGQTSTPSTTGHMAGYDTRKYTAATKVWSVAGPLSQ